MARTKGISSWSFSSPVWIHYHPIAIELLLKDWEWFLSKTLTKGSVPALTLSCWLAPSQWPGTCTKREKPWGLGLVEDLSKINFVYIVGDVGSFFPDRWSQVTKQTVCRLWLLDNRHKGNGDSWKFLLEEYGQHKATTLRNFFSLMNILWLSCWDIDIYLLSPSSSTELASGRGVNITFTLRECNVQK